MNVLLFFITPIWLLLYFGSKKDCFRKHTSLFNDCPMPIYCKPKTNILENNILNNKTMEEQCDVWKNLYNFFRVTG